jgi:hypothetical protein
MRRLRAPPYIQDQSGAATIHGRSPNEHAVGAFALHMAAANPSHHFPQSSSSRDAHAVRFFFFNNLSPRKC